MPAEREFAPLSLASYAKGHHISLPVEFIQELSSADSLQVVLDTVSQWIHQLFDAERASITLKDSSDFLKLYAISGSKAIPLDFHVPISKTFVGRTFSDQTLIICDDLALSNELDCIMLAQSGMKTCMDAPLMSGNICLGTLNVAHKKTSYYTMQHAIELQCLANWIALNINLRLQVKELNYLASTDYLTGAPNRREFTHKIREAIQEFHVNKKVFVLGLMDIDHFKGLNDQFGHNAGDYVLKQVVKITEALIGDQGYLYRIGGEEFAIILEDHCDSGTINRFIIIKDAIAKSIIEYEDREISTTVSIGITHVDRDDYEPESLLKRSDKALYQAKSAGRNRIDTLKPLRSSHR